ncbi:MAG TPA: hypothetical protein VD963_03085 [Phycisphaerales bacterium]|nr:hypothetical protein [Phycisphaerales bacterium]
MLVFEQADRRFWCSPRAWALLARLARLRGWEPGEPPRAIGPDGAETPLWGLPEDGLPADVRLEVSPAEALELARALREALPDLPRFDALEHKSAFQLDLPGQPTVRVVPDGVSVSPYEYFSGANREAMAAFIALCEGGGFTVRSM